MQEINGFTYISELKERAKSYDVLAMYVLGVTYEEGRYTPIDIDQAIYWFEKAANAGDVHSQLHLASLLRIEACYEEMFFWLGEAAKKSHVQAEYRLGYCYEIGLGTEIDYGFAESWYLRAARKGDREALFRLAYLYHRNLCSSPDQGTALRYFRRAANQGHLEALTFLAEYYEKGIVVFRNYEKAFRFYKKAAEGGLPAAQFCLGQMFQFGMGVKKSESEGALWISRAAEQGFVPALYLKSLICLKGLGEPRSICDACMWFLLGKKLDTGLSPALDNMKKQLQSECTGLASEKEWKEAANMAVKWFEDGSNFENMEKNFLWGPDQAD